MHIEFMEPHIWAKTPNGYSTTDKKWGAIIELFTDKNMDDSKLNNFLARFYPMVKEPLKNGCHYSLFPKGLE